jgi:UDP-N-acetylmuramoylalanine-D-glutamate ligase
MRYLGLDLGSRTLGIAISDATGFIASSYKTIRHNEEYDKLLEEVVNLVKEKVHTLIIVGERDNKVSRVFNGLTNLIQVSNLAEAVGMAYYFANEPDVVVYSPANGSEENIEYNANRFLQLVNEL